MLARIVSKRFNVVFKNRYAFGGSHGHGDYSVNINKDTPWVQYKSVHFCLFRMKNWNALKECKMSTIKFNHHWMTNPFNIFKINLSSPITNLSIMNLGITKILMNLISHFLKEDMLTERILLNRDIFIQDQFTSSLWFSDLFSECML